MLKIKQNGGDVITLLLCLNIQVGMEILDCYYTHTLQHKYIWATQQYVPPAIYVLPAICMSETSENSTL